MDKILQRINNVRKKIDYIKKDKEVSTGKGSYRAVTHDMVTAMLRQHLIDEGIVVIISLTKAVTVPPSGDSKQHRYEAEYQVMFCSIDDATDNIAMIVSAHANDSGDKAPGKALSYAKKYAMLKIFEIETGEDDESRTYEGGMLPELLDALLQEISAQTTLDMLQASFKKAYQAAAQYNDANAMGQIIAAKDGKKAALK